MKIMKKILCTVLIVVMCLTSAPLHGFLDFEWPKIDFGEWFSSEASAVSYNGSCGDNLNWSFDTSNGVLTISGSGDMYDYFYDAPWYSYRSSIKTIVLPDGLTSIGRHSFNNCTNLTNISIPNSVILIDDYAFSECTSLVGIIIPYGVITIGSWVFEKCTSLVNITISDSVKWIGTATFRACRSIKRITIPKSVTYIADNVFDHCAILTNITVDENNKSYSSDEYGVLFNKNKTTLIKYPVGNSRSSYIIPNSVTTICNLAFSYCTNLTSVIIPNGVESIGRAAFTSCTNLKTVTLPKSVTNIDDNAFVDCGSLTNLTVDTANQYYSSDENGVLFNKDKTILIQYPIGNIRSSYVIPNNVISIYRCAFHNCKNLVNLTIPDSITTIGESAFSHTVYLDDLLSGKTEEGSITDVYYTGSEEEWNKISIDSYNNDLTNATIHYNSTGPSDNPNSGDNLNKVTIDFTTDTYEVEVDDTVTVSATVTCPTGVENSNLDMVWEVIDPDGTEIVLDGEYSRSETEWACYAEIKGLKEGTYYINLRDNNSTVFDTVKIVVKSDDNIFDHPGGGGDIVVDKTIYPTEAKISGNATNLIYDNDWWKWDKKKFQISGTIDNVLSQYDTWNAAKAESKKKYYNSKGVNQLKDLYITLKSPDTKKIYFKGGKSEITFPLGRTIGAGGSDTFECDVYVDRDYYPPKGSEVIPLECILNGTITDVTIGGKEISGVYSTFDIRITNKSYEWEKQSLKELIAELKSMVRPYEAYYRQNIGPLYGGTALFEDMTAVEVAYSAGSLASSLELGETCFDIIYYFSNMNFTLGDVAKEYGKAFMELLSKDSHDKVSEIIGAMESRLLHNEYFDGFIEWCRVNYGVDAGAYAKYSNHCPTDIIVTSEDGKTVLQIVGDQIIICDDYITAHVFESNKTFYLPTDIDHEIKIIATDNGTMDYFVETVTAYGEKRVVEYNDITLSKGETYTATAPSDISSSTDKFNPVSKNGKIIKADNEQIDHTFGDKDAKCKDCGFDRTQGCSCNCHKGSIKGFFFKFLLFFQKIFRTNKECKCGVGHY